MVHRVLRDSVNWATATQPERQTPERPSRLGRARARGTAGRLHELHQEPHHSRRGRALDEQGIFLPCSGELGATLGAAHGRLQEGESQVCQDSPGAEWYARRSVSRIPRLNSYPGRLLGAAQDQDRQGRLASPLGHWSSVRQTSTLHRGTGSPLCPFVGPATDSGDIQPGIHGRP